jgi:hypothetical protein
MRFCFSVTRTSYTCNPKFRKLESLPESRSREWGFLNGRSLSSRAIVNFEGWVFP